MASPQDGPASAQLRGILDGKSWICFDLDDTLHDYRLAAQKATASALDAIAREHSIPTDALAAEYKDLLRHTTAEMFTDGRTSAEYRKERFSNLMSRFGLPFKEPFADQVLTAYEAGMMSSLTPKPGVLQVLNLLQKAGQQIVIITEGPQDQQERVLHGLKIASKVDFLFSSNYLGVTKTNGLFAKVRGALQIGAEEMAYIGDNWTRDILPAMADGMICIHFDERGPVNLVGKPPSINTFHALMPIEPGETPRHLM